MGVGLPGATGTWCFTGVKGAVMGPGVCCQTAMVQVVGTWARDLNLSVPLGPVSEMGTVIAPPTPTPPTWLGGGWNCKCTVLLTFVIIKGCEPKRYSGSRRPEDTAMESVSRPSAGV